MGYRKYCHISNAKGFSCPIRRFVIVTLYVQGSVLHSVVSVIENPANHLEVDTNEFTKTHLIKLEG